MELLTHLSLRHQAWLDLYKRARHRFGMSIIRSVCVYCGSSPGLDPRYQEAAAVLGAHIANAGLRLVYGGGTNGLMGAVSEGVMAHGGQVTGVIPRFLMHKEATEKALGVLDELIVTEDMHERKHTMFERSDAFVTLPGGVGTLEEVVEMLTWAQLGRHSKPIILANIDGFWDPLMALINHMRDAGFIHTGHRVQPIIVDDIAAIVPAIMDHADGGAGEKAVIERL